MEAFYEMLDQGTAGPADIWLAVMVMQMGLGDKGMYELPFLVDMIMSIEIEQVVNPQAVSRRYKTVYRDITLQGT
jgi:hypothetical protein